MLRRISRWVLLLVISPVAMWGQTQSGTTVSSANLQVRTDVQTATELNRRLQDLVRAATPGPLAASSPQDYRVGPQDLLAITVLDAPDLTRSLRVSGSGEISLPLVGVVKAAGLTPRELEFVLQELLRRTYMKDPHVSIQVAEMQSHPISVVGAVRKAGVFQIWGSQTLLETLSMAEGLAEDAGDTVMVMRAATHVAAAGDDASTEHGGASARPPATETQGTVGASTLPKEPAGGETVEISLKNLLESGDPRYNIRVYPGDIVKVKRAGIIYVVGEVNKAGGFPLRSNEAQTVLQALALGEGLTRTAAKGRTVIIRTSDDGQRTEIPVDLAKILRGKAPDVPLQARDIVFVPNSTSKSLARGSLDAFVRMLTLRATVYP